MWITHLEKLSPSGVIKLYSSLDNLTITEKLDGAMIRFGIDEKGFYTTREGKGKKGKFYSVDEYECVFSTSFQRYAHEVLREASIELQAMNLLTQGDDFHVEVIQGNQPNVLEYESGNCLVILDVSEKAIKINEYLKHRDFEVTLSVPSTPDGRTICLIERTEKWSFKELSPLNIKIDRTLFKPLLDFLGTTTSFFDKTVAEVLELPLNRRIEAAFEMPFFEYKKVLQQHKSYLYTRYDVLINTLKRALVSKYVTGRTSLLGSRHGIEGLVLTGHDFIVKIIDSDSFSMFKNIAWSLRNELGRRPLSLSATEFVPSMYIDLASSLGKPELALIGNRTTEIEIENLDDIVQYWNNYLSNKELCLMDFLDKIHYRDVSDTIKERDLQYVAELYLLIQKTLSRINTEKSVESLLSFFK